MYISNVSFFLDFFNKFNVTKENKDKLIFIKSSFHKIIRNTDLPYESVKENILLDYVFIMLDINSSNRTDLCLLHLLCYVIILVRDGSPYDFSKINTMYEIFGYDIDISTTNRYTSFLRKIPLCLVSTNDTKYASCAESTLLSLLVNMLNYDNTYMQLDTTKIKNLISDNDYSNKILMWYHYEQKTNATNLQF